MIRHTNGYLEEYYRKYKTGEIPVCREMAVMLERLHEDMNSDRYIYDTTKADKYIDIMENLFVQGKEPFFGHRLLLLEWEKAWLSAMYGFLMPGEENDRFRRCLLLISRKNGKELSIDTPIETPFGTKRFADIHEGDLVFGHDGKPVRVLWESETKLKPVYEVTFEDGERIIAGAEHNWTVTNKHWRRLLKYTPKGERNTPSRDEFVFDAYKVKTTQELYDYGLYLKRSDGKGKEYHWRVPLISAPVEYAPQEPVWRPYWLGYWLGNGNQCQPSITCHKNDAEELKGYLNENGSLSQNHQYNIERRDNAWYMSFLNTLCVLKEKNLIKNKHIPEEYFTASVHERLELLKGLMDSDGTVERRGQCCIMQKSPEISKGIMRLLSSLGIKYSCSMKEAKIYEKSYGYCYRINFFVDKEHTVFKLKRKTARLKDYLSPRMKDKTIIDIQPVGECLTKCIAVSDPKQLFAVGERNTLTHNSTLCAGIGLATMLIGGKGLDIVCSSNNDTQANILYDEINTMRMMIDPKNEFTWKNQQHIRCTELNNKVFKISETTRNREGRNITIGLCDEVNELQDGGVIKAIEQSQSTKANPKLIMLTSEGFLQDGVLERELAYARRMLFDDFVDETTERFLPWIYKQDEESECYEGNEENKLWLKSNPSLGVIKKYEYLEQQVAKARYSKEDRAYVLTKDFDIHQNTAAAWLLSEDYSYNYQPFNPEEFRGAVAIGGVDLAETTDLCSAKVILRRPNDVNKYILSMYWIPETKLDPKNDDSQVGAKYKEWQKDDMMRVDSGNYVNTTLVADWFYELWNKYRIRLYKCGYDVRFSQEFTDRMDDYGFDYEMVYQRPEVMSLPNKMVETDLKHQEIIGLNTVDRWCLSNCALKLDSKGFGLVVKIDPSRRIDGAVSLIIAYEIYRRHIDEIERTLK